MKNLEDKLKTLRIKTPSPNLDQRIFAERDAAGAGMHWLQIPVPLGWAAGFAVAAAGLGFWAGAGSNSANRQIDFRQMPVREIHFILDETDSRMFDFSQAAEKNDDYHLNIRYNYQGGF